MHCHFEKPSISGTSNEEKLAPHTNAASSSNLAFLCYSQLSSSNWRFVWTV